MKKLRGILVGIWLVNMLVCLGVAAAFYNGMPAPAPIEEANQQVDAFIHPNQPTRTKRPTITPIPPPTQRATITPFPAMTRPPTTTPLVLPPAHLMVIGQSVEGRSLEVYRFGSGERKKLIVAGIHGGYEWNTVALAEELIAYVDANDGIIPSDTSLYILHNLNPDGYARKKGIDGRANANNVDLNHNFPYNWQLDWSRDGCWAWRTLTGGSEGGSEPETQALMAFIDKIGPEAIISYHSAALGIFPGGNPEFAPSVRLAEAVARVSDYSYPPIDTGCDYTGNLTDWAANTRGIPAIDIELTNHRDTDFEQNLRVLGVFISWNP